MSYHQDSNSATLVDSITVESAGDFHTTTPWGESDLPYIRYDQSGDVVYIAVKDYHQLRLSGIQRNRGVDETLYLLMMDHFGQSMSVRRD